MITPDDYNMVQYFWEEKNDFTRYCGWAKIEPEFRAKHPEFFIAYDAMRDARRNFNQVLKSIVEKHGSED